MEGQASFNLGPASVLLTQAALRLSEALFRSLLYQVLFTKNWTYAASTCTGNRGLKSRLSLPAMSLRRHW
jgi:hypothetical protein